MTGVTLAVYSATRQLGSISLAGGRLTGTSPGLQDVADVAVARAGGDAARAYAALDGWTNGYLTVITSPAEQDAQAAAAFHPDEPRGPHGEWTTGGGEARRTAKGRIAAQTPSQFVHPDTGHKMGKTEIGDTFEALFAARGAPLLEKRFGGPYRLIAGQAKPGGGRTARTTPLDFALDHSHAGELKTMNLRAKSHKTAIKKEEVARKVAAARDGGMEPLLAVQVVDTSTGRVEVFAYPAFASKTTTAMEHLGGYWYRPEDFQAAQEATGHWAQRHDRAAAQGIKAAAPEDDPPPEDPEPEPGDTVIELRDGVPWISTQPGPEQHRAAASFAEDEHPRDKAGKFADKPGGGDRLAAVGRGLARFAGHGGVLAPPQGAATAGYFTDLLAKTGRRLRKKADQERWRRDIGVNFTRQALDPAIWNAGTRFIAARDDHGGLAGAISFYERDDPDTGEHSIRVDYLGTTGSAAGAGTALARAVAAQAAKLGLPVMGEPVDQAAAAFWSKMGWHPDPLNLGAESFWGWTADEAREVAGRRAP